MQEFNQMIKTRSGFHEEDSRWANRRFTAGERKIHAGEAKIPGGRSEDSSGRTKIPFGPLLSHSGRCSLPGLGAEPNPFLGFLESVLIIGLSWTTRVRRWVDLVLVRSFGPLGKAKIRLKYHPGYDWQSEK